jgi:hypothetical protein
MIACVGFGDEIFGSLYFRRPGEKVGRVGPNLMPADFSFALKFNFKTSHYNHFCTFEHTRYPCNKLINFLEPYCLSAGQEIPRLLRNQKFHYQIHKSPPVSLILSQINPVSITVSYSFKINFSYMGSYLGLLNVFYLQYSD